MSDKKCLCTLQDSDNQCDTGCQLELVEAYAFEAYELEYHSPLIDSVRASRLFQEWSEAHRAYIQHVYPDIVDLSLLPV